MKNGYNIKTELHFQFIYPTSDANVNQIKLKCNLNSKQLQLEYKLLFYNIIVKNWSI